MTAPRLNLKEALEQVLEPQGKILIDVGCGDGAMVRHMTRLGAKVTGVEISEAQLVRARSAEAAGDEIFRVGRGENMPFDDATADAILYMNSFHHLPISEMSRALLECVRVLKPGGQLIVIEPLADGPYFNAMKAIEDETEVRAAAYRALSSPPQSLVSEDEFFYETVIRYRDFDHFIAATTAVDPARRERLPSVRAELEENFATKAQKNEDGLFFIAPMRRNSFRKVLD